MIRCPSCARENADNFNFCLDCGYDLKAYREAMSGGGAYSPASQTEPLTASDSNAAVAAAASMAAAASLPPPSSMKPPPASAMGAQRPAAPAPLPEPTTMVLREAAPAAVPSWAATIPAQPIAPDPAAHPAEPSHPPTTISSVFASSPVVPPSESSPTTSSPTATVAPPPAVSQAMSQPAAAPGQAPLAEQITCPTCGTRLPASMRFCGNCGKRIEGVGPDALPSPARTMFMHAAEVLPTAKEKVCKLVTIDQHGKEGMTFTIKSGETLCGRVNGIVLFMDDPYVSPTHCLFRFKDGLLKVLDQRSLNGVYLRVRQERRLIDGDCLRVGRQLFRFESLASAAMQVKRVDGDDARIWGSPDPHGFGRLVQILEDGRTGEIRLLSGERAQLGREQGDIVVPTDGFVSGRHCAFTRRGDETWLADLGSSNGSYVRVRGEADVAHGDFLLVGNQMLRVEIA